ncbi:hypothetical protein [Thermoproteus tenax]|uniref:Type II/IV secretion system protein n=1 Tax=Thermoproteus tenax (strain ATCC 35583 / DSM 2078 / JCM 9277 / NBRC 100435 / Kra 1) TaxID=768679 RepID=G4RJM6_THETK|nr:hypothetical protein [Thermoproteus tenax]CCC81771.1 type II/IV secretion system protein [Thermoproteus tenax Kra 1]
MKFILLVLVGAALVFAQVYVFSDGSGYAVFSHMGFAVYSMDGRLQYVGGAPAYPGPTCIAFYSGAGVSIVTPRGALRAFYPLNFTPTLIASDCRAVVAVNQTAGVYIAPGVRYSFFLPSPPYSVSMLNGTAYVLDMDGDVIVASASGTAVEHIGGYPAGTVASPDCVVASVVRGDTQYFYRVDGGVPQLLATRRAEVGLAYSFAVGPGCRLAYADGRKETAVAVDGPYVIYGTSTGYIEVYYGGQLVYERKVGGPVLSVSSSGLNIAYETPEGVFPLILINETVVSNCGNWSLLREAGTAYSPPSVIEFGNGTRCVLSSNYTASGVVYANYVRQYYVQLSSPHPMAAWLPAGAQLPQPPSVVEGLVELIPLGWQIDGRLLQQTAVEGPLAASAVYRVVPAVNGTLGNGTMLLVKVETPTIVWPQQPAYAVERLYYVTVSPPGNVSGGPGYYPAGSYVTISAGSPQAPPGCRYTFSGWRGVNATAPTATVLVAGPISAAPEFVEECRVQLYTQYGSVVNAPEWAPLGAVLTPSVEPTAVWAPFPFRYVFVGWNINGAISRSFAVSGPVSATAVWVLDPTPLSAIAAALAAASIAVFLASRRRRQGRAALFKFYARYLSVHYQ